MFTQIPSPVKVATVSFISLLAVLLFGSFYLFQGQPSRLTIKPATTSVTIATVAVQGEPSPPGEGEHRFLRILVPEGEQLLKMTPVEKGLLEEFAASQNREPVWIYVNDTETVDEKLASGHGDIVARVNRQGSDDLNNAVLYTMPWGLSRQQLIGRAGGNKAGTLDDLSVRQIALKKSSPAWSILSDLSDDHHGMELLDIPEETDIRTVLDRIKTGHYDLAVVDSLLLPADLEFYFKLEIVMDLTRDIFMTWGVRNDAPALYQSMNDFLNKRHLELEAGRAYREDFPSIKQRRQLRLITYQSPVNYFYEHGRFRGFEYELINRFAEQHDLRLDVVLANTREEMWEMLDAGKGDVIAASLPEGAFSDDTAMAFSRSYSYAAPVLIGRNDETIVDIRDLEDRTIMLSSQSPYLQLLKRVQAQGINFTLLTTGGDLNTETVLFRVARGIYDLTVISSHEINAELSRQLNLKAHLNLSDPQGLVWAVRESSRHLLSALNEYIETEYRRGFYNVIYSRYIDKPDIRSADSKLFTRLDQLSPYDEIVLKYADRYSFDWRLIIAQMYQESRFNPKAVSTAGAEGLMQLMPVTAKMIGVSELRDPEINIHGGIRYMDYLRQRFEDDLAPEDRTWFTLASYNAGFNRVKRARKLAAEMSLDKNKWFDNVEIAMLRMATPYLRGGEFVRNCRCGQAVVYVREIKTLYSNYLRLTQSVRAASTLRQEAEEI